MQISHNLRYIPYKNLKCEFSQKLLKIVPFIIVITCNFCLESAGWSGSGPVLGWLPCRLSMFFVRISLPKSSRPFSRSRSSFIFLQIKAREDSYSLTRARKIKSEDIAITESFWLLSKHVLRYICVNVYVHNIY